MADERMVSIDDLPVRLTDEMIALHCPVCARALAPAAAVADRAPREVVYKCPDDGAALVRVFSTPTQNCSGYTMNRGVELTVRVGGRDMSWWDFVTQDSDIPGKNT